MGLVSEKKSYLKIQIGPTRAVHTQIVESPGRWMTPEQLEKLVLDLRTVVSALGIGELNYGIFTGSKELLDHCVVTIIYDGPQKRPVAFNSMTFMNCQLRGKPVPVLHLGLTVVDPLEQSKGYTWTLYGLSTILLLLKNRLRPFWMTNVTQVPVVLGKVSENFSEVYPNPKGTQRRTFDHLSLARQIMSQYRFVFGVAPEAEFDEEEFVIRNAYTGGSDHLKKKYDDCARHRFEVYNQYCQEKLNYERGDDFLQVGKIDLTAIFQYIFRSLPKNFIITFLAQASLVLLDSYVAPVLQWFSTRKQYGELRPR